LKEGGAQRIQRRRRSKMEQVLWNYADRKEGRVETRHWGACSNPRCDHTRHDPYFRFFVTFVEGEIIWEGENGEKLVRSTETGRVFYTRYDQRGDMSPIMGTEEIVNGKVSDELWLRLIDRYGSERHVCLMALANVLAQLQG
jgi:hypothetical protein